MAMAVLLPNRDPQDVQESISPSYFKKPYGVLGSCVEDDMKEGGGHDVYPQLANSLHTKSVSCRSTTWALATNVTTPPGASWKHLIKKRADTPFRTKAKAKTVYRTSQQEFDMFMDRSQSPMELSKYDV